MSILIDQINTQIAKRHLLFHPFYQMWSAGELNLNILQDYAVQYYFHVTVFPTYISTLHSRSRDPYLRQALVQNLMDEEGNYPSHPDMWLQFASGLGLSEQRLLSAEPYEETINLIERFYYWCGLGDLEGLCALYSYESQIPVVAVSKLEGLKKFYGIEDQKTLAYFRVHAQMDIEHSDKQRAILETILTEETIPQALEVVNEITSSLYNFLDGICVHNGLTFPDRVLIDKTD